MKGREGQRACMRIMPQRRLAGFTLLELLMVVIIIAILAAQGLPQYFRVVERSRTGQVLQLLGSIRGSQARFKGQDPSNLYDPGAMANIDLSPFPAMVAWGAPASTGAVAGSNVTVVRNGGVHNGAILEMDLDLGAICASTAAAAADWGVAGPGC